MNLPSVRTAIFTVIVLSSTYLTSCSSNTPSNTNQTAADPRKLDRPLAKKLVQAYADTHPATATLGVIEPKKTDIIATPKHINNAGEETDLERILIRRGLLARHFTEDLMSGYNMFYVLTPKGRAQSKNWITTSQHDLFDIPVGHLVVTDVTGMSKIFDDTHEEIEFTYTIAPNDFGDSIRGANIQIKVPFSFDVVPYKTDPQKTVADLTLYDDGWRMSNAK